MTIITVYLSDPHVKTLALLQEMGIYPSRSEAIRVSIRDFLMKELGFVKKFDDLEVTAITDRASTSMKVPEKKKEIARLLKKLNEDKEDANNNDKST